MRFRGFRGLQPLFSNRRGSTILYNFIRKEISNAINNCYQVNHLFQKFLNPGLHLTIIFDSEDAVDARDATCECLQHDACLRVIAIAFSPASYLERRQRHIVNL